MVLPAPLNDEIFCSLLARMGRMNGYADLRDMMLILCGGRPCSSFVDTEIDLAKFSRQTDFAYPEAADLLEHLTWYGIQLKLGEIPRHRIDGLVTGDVRLAIGLSVFADSAVLGYCPSCRSNDSQQWGMTYWHRLHQLPIVFFCPIHGDRVVRVRIKRLTLHNEFPLPGDFESERNNSEPMYGLNENFWRGVAVMAAEAIQGDRLPDAEVIFSVLSDELRREKFVPPLSRVRLTALVEQLAEQAFENPSQGPESVTFLKRIAHSFDEPATGMVLGRIVLLYWLFGGWKSVQERCNWLSVFGSESGVTVVKPATVLSKLEAQYRCVCTTYIREHPGCTRLDFLKAEYRSFRWLLHNDKIWLERKLPIPSRRGKQLVLF